jgi:hypothetical protein
MSYSRLPRPAWVPTLQSVCHREPLLPTSHGTINRQVPRLLLTSAALWCLAAAGLHAQTPVQSYINAFWSETEAITNANASHFIAGSSPALAVEERALKSVAKPGAIHHLRGHVFVPGASLPAIVLRVRDYNTHAELFSSTLRKSALCSNEGENVFVFRYWSTPYMDSVTETRATHKQLDDNRYVVTSITSALGGPRDLPDKNSLCKGTLPGVFYMKQLHAVWRYEQTPEGTRIEAELVAELSGFAPVRSTAKRVLAQMMNRSLESYREKFRPRP